MATTKERILITLAPDEARAIRAVAKREGRPRATIAARAIRHWLEDEEDRYLAALGDEILKETKRWYTHEEVWGKLLKR